MRTTTRLAAATAALAGLALLPAAGAATAGALEPTTSVVGTTTSTTTSTSSYGAPEHQRITLAVDGCNRCRIGLAAYDRQRNWHSRTQLVGPDGKASFIVPQRWVDGVAAHISAPWAGNIGAVPHIVFRYAGERTGDAVTAHEAESKRRGSLCLRSDPSQLRSTVPITVRRERVRGVDGKPTDGLLAFAAITQRSAPMTHTYHGLGGAQDVPPCQY